jgi:hypothetical protein
MMMLYLSVVLVEQHSLLILSLHLYRIV